MIAPPPSLRDSRTIGRYRVDVWEEHTGQFRVELRELEGREWILIASDRESNLAGALTFAAELAEGLRPKVKHEA